MDRFYKSLEFLDISEEEAITILNNIILECDDILLKIIPIIRSEIYESMEISLLNNDKKEKAIDNSVRKLKLMKL